MADQAVMNGNTKSSSRPNGVIQGVGSFGADLATLAVLQARLGACELGEGLKRATPLLGILIIAVMVSVSGIVAMVLGLSLWLSAFLEVRLGPTMMLVGLASVVLSGVSAQLCIRALTSSPSMFQRSNEEFERNLAWIRTTLLHSGR